MKSSAATLIEACAATSISPARFFATADGDGDGQMFGPDFVGTLERLALSIDEPLQSFHGLARGAEKVNYSLFTLSLRRELRERSLVAANALRGGGADRGAGRLSPSTPSEVNARLLLLQQLMQHADAHATSLPGKI